MIKGMLETDGIMCTISGILTFDRSSISVKFNRGVSRVQLAFKQVDKFENEFENASEFNRGDK